jgi:hypothetical protein
MYDVLPVETRELADRSFALLQNDSRHPSLHFKRIRDLWSVRVGLNYRALAYEERGDLVWFWIGNHEAYDSALAGR